MLSSVEPKDDEVRQPIATVIRHHALPWSLYIHDLRHADLTNTVLVDAILTSANLSGANLTETDLIGAILGHAHLVMALAEKGNRQEGTD